MVRVCIGEPATARAVGFQHAEDMEQGHPGLSQLCLGLLLVSPIGRTPQGWATSFLGTEEGRWVENGCRMDLERGGSENQYCVKQNAEEMT